MNMQNLMTFAESDLFTLRMPPLEPLRTFTVAEEASAKHPKRKFIRKWRDYCATNLVEKQSSDDDHHLCHLAKGNT